MTTKKNTQKEYKKCITCLGDKNPKTMYYKSYSKYHGDGLIPICKSCLEIKDENDIHEVREKLRVIDKPYRNNLWQKAIESKKQTFGMYLKMLALSFQDETYDDSDFDNQKRISSTNIDPSESENGNKDNEVNDAKSISDYLMDKWGVGYKPHEYEYFERKYNILKNNYQEKTSMHREALLTYIRYRVKEELATAEGDVKSAKEWGALASKQAQDAKINPAQLSKADLSDGLDTFGQLVRTVEQSEDIIPQLPHFKAKPQDSVDFTIWCYINYIRDLKGLPLAEYDDIYRFYEERKKEYDNRLDDEGDR